MHNGRKRTLPNYRGRRIDTSESPTSRGDGKTLPANEPSIQTFIHRPTGIMQAITNDKTERNQAHLQGKRKEVRTNGERHIWTPFPPDSKPFFSIKRSKLSPRHTLAIFLWQCRGLLCIQKIKQLVRIDTSSSSTTTHRLHPILYARVLALSAKQDIYTFSIYSLCGQGYICGPPPPLRGQGLQPGPRQFPELPTEAGCHSWHEQ